MGNNPSSLIKTARIAGIWYLLLAIGGVGGFMIFHPKVYVSNDAAQTLVNLVEEEFMARIRLLFELLIVVSQALAAVWFYRLFRNINEWAAWALGVWGTVNSVIILVSAVSMGAALEVAGSAMTIDDKVVLVQLLQQFIANAWGVGGLFFGLWLIPMGYVVTSSKCMPAWLGRVLMIGGAGYLLGTFLNYFGVEGDWLGVLVIPATVGEFWMIVYLLVFGIRNLEGDGH
ncbi:MAG: DUF4386 domain-containing protein [Cyclobacteriaceae bacterium]